MYEGLVLALDVDEEEGAEDAVEDQHEEKEDVCEPALAPRADLRHRGYPLSICVSGIAVLYIYVRQSDSICQARKVP